MKKRLRVYCWDLKQKSNVSLRLYPLFTQIKSHWDLFDKGDLAEKGSSTRQRQQKPYNSNKTFKTIKLKKQTNKQSADKAFVTQCSTERPLMDARLSFKHFADELS